MSSLNPSRHVQHGQVTHLLLLGSCFLENYPVVLVSGDRCELGLREQVGLEVLGRGLSAPGRVAALPGGGGPGLPSRRDVDDMQARLVAVHRVKDYL